MKKLLFAFVLVLAAWSAAGQKTVITDANVVARTLNGSFTAIKVSGSIDLYLSQSDTESAAVSAGDEEQRENIKTVVENGTLRIYYKGNSMFKWKNHSLKVYVSFKKLEQLTISGASAVQVTGAIETGYLSVNCSGASTFKSVVKADELHIDLSGASDTRISGVAGSLKVVCSGASDLKGYDLLADSCDAKASGASSIKVTVNKEINVRASGASSILFKGDAVIRDMHSSGASTVSRKK
ncbi:MAG TPA: head GIN domain-containing protein [Ferruginibacter sp.]|nr:head GIN domain-containing protein [Ferruginibacter sp.]HMP22035.1 head GIN domain-containing protein [Ferruginibacter sp.]